MTEIESAIVNKFQSDWINVIGTHIAGEGEQKLIQVYKRILPETAVFITHDSDVIVLTLLMDTKKRVWIEIPSFKMTIDVHALDIVFANLQLTGHRLLWACLLCGNDFFPAVEDKLPGWQIIGMLMRNKTLASFKDLVVSKEPAICVCDEDITAYANLWKWFEEYFTTNEPISTTPYYSEIPPCIACLKDIALPDAFLPDQTENHLEFVLSEEQRRSEYF